MANNAVVTAAGIVGMTWQAPIDDGGSPIIDYQISYKTGSAAFQVLTTGVMQTSYTATQLIPGAYYTFKVTARNLVGYGPDSSEVKIIAARIPD